MLSPRVKKSSAPSQFPEASVSVKGNNTKIRQALPKPIARDEGLLEQLSKAIARSLSNDRVSFSSVKGTRSKPHRIKVTIPGVPSDKAVGETRLKVQELCKLSSVLTEQLSFPADITLKLIDKIAPACILREDQLVDLVESPAKGSSAVLLFGTLVEMLRLFANQEHPQQQQALEITVGLMERLFKTATDLPDLVFRVALSEKNTPQKAVQDTIPLLPGLLANRLINAIDQIGIWEAGDIPDHSFPTALRDLSSPPPQPTTVIATDPSAPKIRDTKHQTYIDLKPDQLKQVRASLVPATSPRPTDQKEKEKETKD